MVELGTTRGPRTTREVDTTARAGKTLATVTIVEGGTTTTTRVVIKTKATATGARETR